MMRMEKDGIDLEKLNENSSDLTLLAKAIFEQLTEESQKEFETFKNFTKCVTPNIFKVLTEGFSKCMEEAQPTIEGETEKK